MGEFITKQGLAKLKQELGDLVKYKRPEIAERIKEAVALGELTENAEYAEAKDQQGFIEGRISEIENTLRTVRIVSATPRGRSFVQIGCAVHLNSLRGRGRRTFMIRGKGEGRPEKGEISSDSPIGQAILGQKVGDEVEVPTPAGNKRFKIIRIA